MSLSPTKSTSTVSVASDDVTRVSDEVNSPAAGDSQQKTKADVPVNEAASTESSGVKKATDAAAAGKPGAGIKPAMTSGKTTKSGDQQEFVPAPPPATNAWAKRMQTPSSGAATQSSSAANTATSSGNAVKAEVSVSDSKKENATDSSTAKSSTDKKSQKKEIEVRKTVGTSTEQGVKTSETTPVTVAMPVTTPRGTGTASSTSGATTPRGTTTAAAATITGNILPPAPTKSVWGTAPAGSSSSSAPRAATESCKQPQKAAVTAPAPAAGLVERVEKSTETETNSSTTTAAAVTSTVSAGRSVEVSVSAATAGTKRPTTVSKTAESAVSSTTNTQTSAVVAAQEASSSSITSSGHVTRSDESRRWEKNPASSHRHKSKDDQQAKAAGLNDSADWPSLNKQDGSVGTVGDSPTTSMPPTTTTDSQSTTTTTTDATVEQQQPVVSADTSPVDTASDNTPSVTTTISATTVIQNHVKPSSDSSADDSKDASNSSAQQQQSKKKGKGSKQKWFPLEIEIPKPRRRRGTGRPRTDSREFPEPGGRDSREGRDREGPGSEPGHETREGGAREPGSGGAGRRPGREGRGGGRESHDRGGIRRNRREPVDKVQRRQSESEVDGQHSDNVQSDRLRETSSSRGWNNHSPVTSNMSPHNSTSPSGPLSAPARMGYQGSRRAASRGTRGGAGYNGQPRGSATNRFTQQQQQQQQPIWPTGAAGYSYFSFGGIDTQFCYQVEPTAPATFFTPIVSQSDYYTSVLADEPTKKLISQQIEYYFSRENLMKDFFLRRQMDNDGWIPVELLASFRRVRIHTGAVNVQLIVDSMAGSKVVEMSPDGKHMRTRFDPLTWSLQGVEPTKFSSLNAEVPEFVPGQPFKLSSPSLPTQVDAATPGESAATSTASVDEKSTDVGVVSAGQRTTPDKKTDPTTTTTTTTDITQESLATEAASTDDKESIVTNSSVECHSSPSHCPLPPAGESDSPAPAGQTASGATNSGESATESGTAAGTAVTTGTTLVPTPDQD